MKINLGCGLEKLEGYMSVDKRLMLGAEMVHDLDVMPWPFDDCSAEEIRAFDVFEHLEDVIGAMDECWRILQPGGRLTIRGPAPDSPNLWVDVTHRRAFVEHSFDHFDWTTELGLKYRYGRGPWRVASHGRDGENIMFELIRLAS